MVKSGKTLIEVANIIHDISSINIMHLVKELMQLIIPIVFSSHCWVVWDPVNVLPTSRKCWDVKHKGHLV